MYQLRLDFFWFFGRPEVSTFHAECNGDRVKGEEIANRHLDQLRDLIVIHYQRLIAPCSTSDGKPHSSEGVEGLRAPQPQSTGPILTPASNNKEKSHV